MNSPQWDLSRYDSCIGTYHQKARWMAGFIIPVLEALKTRRSDSNLLFPKHFFMVQREEVAILERANELYMPTFSNRPGR